MTDPAARPARSARPLPRLGAVVRAQLTLVAAPPRRGLAVALGLVLLQIVFLAAAGLIFGIHVQVGSGGTTHFGWARLGDLELAFPFDEGLAAVFAAFVASAVWGLFWPFRVWREETPSRRGYHWAMPVDRRAHDLARVAAGAAWLLAIALLLVGAAVAAAALSGHATHFATLAPAAWLAPFTASLILYLLASIAAVRAKRPAAWVWGSLGAFGFAWTLAEALRLAPVTALLRALAGGRLGLAAAFGAGLPEAVLAEPVSLGRWALATLLWLAVGAAGVWAAAASRPRNI
jgi:hypothetical protein